MSALSIVLIVKDEESRMEACLQSVAWADEIIVVDGGSKDGTVELARRYTSKVYERAFDHFSNQKNYGVERATGEWIFSIDADEIVSPKLKASLLKVLKEGSSFDGFYLQRINFLFGRRLLFAGQGKEKLLRFFRKGRGRFEQPIHEKVRVEGKTGELSEGHGGVSRCDRDGNG